LPESSDTWSEWVVLGHQDYSFRAHLEDTRHE